MGKFSIKGKKAIVTGGTRGLGHGMAEGLMEEGVEVVIFGSNDKVYSIAEEFQNRGFKCHGVKSDLSNRNEVINGFNEAIEKLGGKLDILVNCAGMNRPGSADKITMSDWDAVLSVHVHATFLLCQMAGKIMLEQGSGRIINIASLISFFGGNGIPAYAASKGAIMQLTKSLSNDWAPKGLRVNAIVPGYMMTDLNERIINDKERFEHITSRIPVGRWGTPDDMKGLVVFLCSEASEYITGAIIPVDGGYMVK